MSDQSAQESELWKSMQITFMEKTIEIVKKDGKHTVGQTPHNKFGYENEPEQRINGRRRRGGERLAGHCSVSSCRPRPAKKVTTYRLIRPLLFVIGRGE